MADFLKSLIDQTFARALAYYKAGDAATAEGVFRTVLDIAPDHAEAAEWLLLTRLDQGDLEAGKDYRAWLATNPSDSAGPYLLLGYVAEMTAQTGLARFDYRRAAVLEPYNAVVWLRAGRAAAADNAVPEGVALMIRATLIDPTDAAAWRALGDVHMKPGAEEAALHYFLQALALADTADLRACAGRALLTLGDMAGALHHFEVAIRQDPDRRDGWLGSVQALVALERADEAAERLAGAAARFQGRGEDLREIAFRFLDIGRRDEAARAYAAAMAGDPNRPKGAEPRILRRRRAADLCAERGWPYTEVQPERAVTCVDDTGRRHDVVFPEVFLARVDGARIVTATWAVTCGDTVLLDGLLHYDPDSLGGPEFPKQSRSGDVLSDLPPPAARIEGEAILIGGVANWSHLVQEWLSRLTVLERFPELDRLPLLVTPHMMRSVRDLMALLGVDPARIVTLPDVPVIEADRLWIPSLTHRHKFASPLHIDFLRRRLAPRIAEGMRRSRRRLFMLRRSANYRTLVNEQELLDALAPLGVEAVAPEDYSMAEQIALFASAELVVGALGGGTAAILFCPPGAAFVELTHRQFTIAQYGVLTATLHQRYRRVVGPTLENRGSTTYDFDFSVRPEEVVAACRSVLGMDAGS
ncbi:glycosyltransferase family 61 protein [Azospirillum sp. TSO22-1]|uniref:glycosyltransferase family 61 protein n=1 Tax=Azospirillum sp. TSO22-1 TaxID=716789 RepID=UPI000D620154|nr:glycosyltransferase family 61 protein [Azospirillum sp. TSO22-1]PWC55541.1 hypothetical protein TSO221_04500 [Azospirillum sp. TSO22-1]